MLLKEYKAIFVHVPKTAGQSIEDYFLRSLSKDRKQDGADFLLKLNPNYPLGPKRWGHLTASEYVDLGFIDSDRFQTFFKFAFVRNPWDRIVSLYKFSGFSAITQFSIFVKYYLPQYLEEEAWFFKPQSEYIYNSSDELLCDFIGKMESLQSDFNQVLDTLKLENGRLPHTNKSNPKFLSRKTLSLFLNHPKLLLNRNNLDRTL